MTQIIGGNIARNTAGTEGAGIEADSGTMTLTGTAVTDNKAGLYGGGIRSLGTLSMIDVTVARNSANTASGGLVNRGTLTMTDCTVADNKAGYNGGIANDPNPDNGTAGVVTMTGCTVSGNMATLGVNGGIGNESASDMMTLINCTLAGNTAINSGGGIGNSGNPAASQLHHRAERGHRRGWRWRRDRLRLRQAHASQHDRRGQSPGAGPNTVPSDIFKHGAFVLDTQSTYNLIGTGGAGDVPAFTQHNLLGVDPRLGPLQDNGGPTQTMALLDGSPAFDAGSNALVPAGLITDQRGAARV